MRDQAMRLSKGAGLPSHFALSELHLLPDTKLARLARPRGVWPDLHGLLANLSSLLRKKSIPGLRFYSPVIGHNPEHAIALDFSNQREFLEMVI
jgi:hypothetical protein